MKKLSTILFFGAIWGLIEATVGHILHFLPMLIAGSVLFPFAAFILVQARKQLDHQYELLYVGLIAASIKAIDFLLPGLSVYKTINPMVSIVMEALIVFAVIKYMSSEKEGNKIVMWQSASIGWRVLFVTYMAIQFALTGNLAPYIDSLTALLSFVLLEGIISGLFAYGLIHLNKKELIIPFTQKYAVSLSLVVIALISTFYL